MKLTVIYDAKGKIDSKLDNEIRQAIIPLGFRFYASGCDRTNGKRDLAFEKTLTKANILDFIVDCGTVLTEQNDEFED